MSNILILLLFAIAMSILSVIMIVLKKDITIFGEKVVVRQHFESIILMSVFIIFLIVSEIMK